MNTNRKLKLNTYEVSKKLIIKKIIVKARDEQDAIFRALSKSQLTKNSKWKNEFGIDYEEIIREKDVPSGCNYEVDQIG